MTTSSDLKVCLFKKTKPNMVKAPEGFYKGYFGGNLKMTFLPKSSVNFQKK